MSGMTTEPGMAYLSPCLVKFNARAGSLGTLRATALVLTYPYFCSIKAEKIK